MTSFEVPSVGLRAIFIEHTLRVSVSYGHHLRNAAAIAGCSGGGRDALARYLNTKCRGRGWAEEVSRDPSIGNMAEWLRR